MGLVGPLAESQKFTRVILKIDAERQRVGSNVPLKLHRGKHGATAFSSPNDCVFPGRPVIAPQLSA